MTLASIPVQADAQGDLWVRIVDLNRHFRWPPHHAQRLFKNECEQIKDFKPVKISVGLWGIGPVARWTINRSASAAVDVLALNEYATWMIITKVDPNARFDLINAFGAYRQADSGSKHSLLIEQLKKMQDAEATDRLILVGVMKEVEHLNKKKRAHISRAVEDLLIECSRLFYADLCPCCQRNKLIDDATDEFIGQREHNFGPNNSKLEAMWVVCRECNQRLENPKFRTERQPMFLVFQERLNELKGGQGHLELVR